ncbi:antiviral helicase SLH1 [Protomyces lactucae-debilis]|uniref:RNA helicase n=1 Tax=Protomyces lactucae-debilis TaxID=2754530 RepID=A0A1Y2F7F6_PROLT|nr:antiviral helicase SLH1 [Protomyces lactucae-debilis]ORY79832.1 antiviral helicase SLH1 [Protomyces lactucae-debilis]
MDANVLYSNLTELLLSEFPDDDLQMSLAELLGFDDLDTVSRLIQSRSQIKRSLTSTNQTPRSKAPVAQTPKKNAMDGLMTQDDIKRQVVRNGKRPLFSNANPKIVEEERYPHVYGASSSALTMAFNGKSLALPQDSTREEHDYYEEITIPPARTIPPMLGEEPKVVEHLDALCSNTFKGYKTLNRIQSLVYNVAYTTNENMLICAPTGAGKTDVAMLTILQTLANNCTPDPHREPSATEFTLHKDDFKIIYVAPMKALAAEIVEKFSKKLSWLGVKCRELTGDMQLTKHEIQATQILVTTPEKWDVVTRKGMTGDVELVQKVRLLILDEVHMLHDERGAVIESLVARTLRYVEASQSMVRIVGLSATLPNYLDVADFLKVNRYVGLFFFSSAFRPVGLEQHFIGVKGKAGSKVSNERLDKATFEKVHELVKEGHQVMVFVHARKATVKTATTLLEMATAEGDALAFDPSEHAQFDIAKRDLGRSKNRELRELFVKGFGIHHAGMLRSDRNLVEKYFGSGVLKVLCCTATLAWGVNLPAYAVVIRGTQLYDPQKGSFVDLGVLDVLQIFGRAGRPQFETHGVGYICTTHDKLAHYTNAITAQHPIESQFAERLVDNLNAEISLGTVTNVTEAVSWLSYTYLFVRMRKNPRVYGIEVGEYQDDPALVGRRRDLIIAAAMQLHKTQMIVYNPETELLTPKDLGRIASNFYISHKSIEVFNELMKPKMAEADVFNMISLATEFSQMQSRDNEHQELDQMRQFAAPCQIKAETSTTPGKVNTLLQGYVSKASVEDFALVSDTNYVAQNGARVARALFEIALSRSWPSASVILSVGQMIDKRMWSFEHPLGQMDLKREVTMKLEEKHTASTIEQLREMDAAELGALINFNRMGHQIKNAVDNFPLLSIEYEVAPLTRQVLRVKLYITPDFNWYSRIHGTAEHFWIWVEDDEGTEILYHESFMLTQRKSRETHEMSFTIPLADPIPSQIYVRAVSDRWLGAETVTAVSLSNLILPRDANPATELLNLQPLPITALQDPILEDICAQRFLYFNPVQTQYFHTLYHTDQNVLVGAPTGSGKTTAAELALWWAFRKFPKGKVVYIAPMKALVRERVNDWTARLTGPMQRKLVELTGDNTPDTSKITSADIIITTPEKWDGISRSWKNRGYVRDISLVIIDEIHLLGGDRGPILEVIVSRMNYIAQQTKKPVRIVGLSTAVANPLDLAEWLNIKPGALYNFRHAAPVEIYIDDFPGRAYCPRMASMNRPAFAAIKTHAPNKPVLIFVSSRRQTRLTAQDLITLCGNEDNPRRFMHMPDEELEMILTRVTDESLRLSLQFGIALHHASLTEDDRRLSEELFTNQKVQILVATSTLAWGINTPASLVIIKGTEYFDAKIGGYKDMDLTDVLQMLGRAGRPQYDTHGIARIFVKDNKKSFYKHFLHSGFPVESSLHNVLPDHLCAELAAETIISMNDAFDFLTGTYYFRRIQQNPSYYGLQETSSEGLIAYMTNWLTECIDVLMASHVVEATDLGGLRATSLGKITSYYYLSHKTIRKFVEQVCDKATFEQALRWLSEATEFDEQPVRHNEDLVNAELAKLLRFNGKDFGLPMWDPHVKAYLLLQAHFERLTLSIADYITDTISVLDQSIRVLQAYIDVTAEQGCWSTTARLIELMVCVKQGIWHDDHSLLLMPGVQPAKLKSSKRAARLTLLEVAKMGKGALSSLAQELTGQSAGQFMKIAQALPVLQVSMQPFDGAGKLHITLKRMGRMLDPTSGKAYCPRFPKQQSEGWFVLLVNPQNDELLALKRASIMPGHGSLTTKAHLSIPDECLGLSLQLHVVSDIYPGITFVQDLVLGRKTTSALTGSAPEVMQIDPGASKYQPGQQLE